MSEQKKSMYVGNAKAIILQTGASAMSVTICANDLWEHMKNPEAEPAIFTSKKTGKKYVTLSVFPLKPENVEEGKRTHSVKLDTWKPSK